MSSNQGSMLAIGLMSGTSMDGIDLALIETDGEGLLRRMGGSFTAYDAAFRKRLEAGLEDARAICHRNERPGTLAALEAELSERHAAAVLHFLEERALAPSAIRILGFHGQTVLHRPLDGLTVQIGDGALLAARTGIATVHDMRANDMVHGGQGAPLVPVYHRALAANIAGEHAGKGPVVFVNIGGISNITYIGTDGQLIAFDSGPGNTLIDQWVTRHAGIPFDCV